jgi:hypothetical protein
MDPPMTGHAIIILYKKDCRIETQHDSHFYSTNIQLLIENVLKSLLIYIAVQLCKISSQLNVLRTNLYAVLGVTAAGNTALAHKSLKTLLLVELSKWMEVEQVSLYRWRCTDEVGLRSNVRASLQAAATGHAVRNLICSGCSVRILDRSILNLPGTINLNPSLYALEGLEHYGTVNQEVTDYRECSGWLQANWLLQLIDQCTAGLTGTTVNNHHTSATNLLQAVALPNYRSNLLAVSSYRVLLNFHQGSYYIQSRTIWNLELLSVRLAGRAVLTLNNKLNCFLLFCHSILSPYYSFFATA